MVAPAVTSSLKSIDLMMSFNVMASANYKIALASASYVDRGCEMTAYQCKWLYEIFPDNFTVMAIELKSLDHLH